VEIYNNTTLLLSVRPVCTQGDRDVIFVQLIFRHSKTPHTPFFVCAKGSHITVVFESDHSVTAVGFRANVYYNGMVCL